MKKINIMSVMLAFLLAFQVSFAQSGINVLVFSKTAAFRHASIEAGQAALKKMASEKGFTVSFTEDASQFSEANLKKFNAVLFLNTTGDVLNGEQQVSFERYIQAGGGYVGVHAATDTEYDWPWYNMLAGAWFQDHPNPDNVQKGRFFVTEKNALTAHMPESFERTDEFYSFKNISDDINVVLKIDETTYRGGTNGDNHPMSWYHEFQGGRAFYTAMGHTDETFGEPLFLTHLWEGLRYVTGGDQPNVIDFSKAKPEENRFTKVVLKDKLDEPVEIAVLDDDRVLFIQRKGQVKLYKNSTAELTNIADIPVSLKYVDAEGKESVAEDGLLGLSKDPNFAKNNWIYMYYSSLEGSYNVLSRFTMKGDELDLNSEVQMLKVETQREQCCHTGGSIDWDANGNLFLSTGDNTNPHASNGFSPSDERPGRSPWDAQKSSANTNDLRGKILRITPQADGSYTIPEGNLFPKGMDKTRPEIFTMGHRNPYRIAVDKKTGALYWGDVGPDANAADPNRGAAGTCEFGQAFSAGNYGWPHFVGDNKAYNKFDFATNTSGEKWDYLNPMNTSPNNTGLIKLPQAQEAMVWYTYDKSEEFPLVGAGGCNPMAGPVYYKDMFKGAEGAFPEYYDGKHFIYEWMRGWIMAVSFDENGKYKSMEPFMPSYKFSNPMDMEFADNGDLYMLEYGSGWFSANDDARLIRIEYNGGNRMPKVVMNKNADGGAVPFKLALSAEGTTDPDGDELAYEWTITGDDFASSIKGQTAELSLKDIGVYTVNLTVNDGNGGKISQSTEVVAGNEPPVLTLEMPGSNKSFFAPNRTFNYDIKVSDKEDGKLGEGINADQVAVNIDYLAEGFDKVEIARGHRSADASAAYAKGRKLIDGSDCLACHKVDDKSIGPSYTEVSKKYKGDSKALEMLTAKIINGGGGNWGEMAMSAHPQITKEDASEMVKYILNIANQTKVETLPVKGTYAAKVKPNDTGAGVYIVRASYEDQGANGMPSLRSEQTFVLRNSKIGPHDFDSFEDINKMSFGGNKLSIISKSGANVMMNQIDLGGIKGIEFLITAPVARLNTKGGKIQLRLGGPKGKLIGQSEFIEPWDGGGFAPKAFMVPVSVSAEEASKLQDLCVVFSNPGAEGSLFIMMGAEFKMLEEGEAVGAAAPSSYDDFFVGKWNTTIVGTPQGDANMLLTLVRENGKLSGTIAPDMDGVEPVALDNVEETDASVTIYFKMMNYDLNVELVKEDDVTLAGKMMGMFDVTSERVIEKADFFSGDWDMMIKGTPQGDAKMTLHLERKDGQLTGSIIPEDAGMDEVALDNVEETDGSVTIYFNMMNYDLNVELMKAGDTSLEGKLMGMFDVTADKK
ncbi:ThuA domain-containing protein [Jiulongibacter sediminis]|uniref:ThuA domain-containing protein n=1 Tax=Jiulongibacter sediminis TaxID=1605367 RepID=UPI0009EA1457|nr:ThuA domain-containing protein [Jiulongibacter sediminis]